MSKHKRPTLQDIADQLGITKMTVSRYLRDPKTVSAETGKKIAQAIDQVGYIRNRAPELLSNAKSRSIGVLLPSLTNSVFAEVLRGIESVTDEAGYQTMLAHYGYNQEKEEQRLESLLSYHIDGIILSETQHSPRTLRMLEIADIPVIEIMDTSEKGVGQAVGFHNIFAAQEMVEAMIARGHQHIVYFAARMDRRTQLKKLGYEQAMRKHHLTPRTLATERSSSFSLGAELLHLALETYPEIDGIFCTNDDLAIGALFECQRLGISVPTQMAIAGFHGLDVGQAFTPQLASVITPRFEIGKIAAQQLLAQLQQQPVADYLDLGYQIHLGETI